jgi:fermentation-respiration switch protein FrsA (DUF1100 family)
MNQPTALRRRYFRNLALTAVIASGMGCLLITAVLTQRQLEAFLGSRPSIPDIAPQEFGLPFEDLQLTSSDGLSLRAWLVPAQSPNGAGMILVHGLGANRSALLPTAEILHRNGYHVLLLDLRGHGESEGDQITYGYLEALDVMAGMEYMTVDLGLEPDRIGLLGVSMGGAAVVRAAGMIDQVGAIVIESSPSSLEGGIIDAFDEMSLLPRWPFAILITALAERRVGARVEEVDSCRILHTLQGLPKLLIHGDQDTLLPLEHHLRMVDAAAEPKESWIVAGMGHESAATYAPGAYENRLIEFLDRYLLGGVE